MCTPPEDTLPPLRGWRGCATPSHGQSKLFYLALTYREGMSRNRKRNREFSRNFLAFLQLQFTPKLLEICFATALPPNCRKKCAQFWLRATGGWRLRPHRQRAPPDRDRAGRARPSACVTGSDTSATVLAGFVVSNQASWDPRHLAEWDRCARQPRKAPMTPPCRFE